MEDRDRSTLCCRHTENVHHVNAPKGSDIAPSIKGILITDSGCDTYGIILGSNSFLFLRPFLTERKDIKLSGVCFGHQILSRALGAKVEQERAGEWRLSHTRMDLT